jgi:hypothetical protein
MPVGGTANPDGTPNFPASVGVGISKTPTLWSLPTDVPNGQKLWFDTGHTTEPNYDPTTESRNRASFGTHVNGSSEVLKTPAEIMAHFAADSQNNPQEFLALQKLLASGPWGSGTVYPTGSWDNHTEAALSNAMSLYFKLASTGVAMSFSQYLTTTAERAQALGGKGTSMGAGAGGSTAIPRVMDPAQIRNAAQNAAQQALGRGLDEKQLEQFVTQFQQEQLSNQDDPYTTTYKLPGEAMQFAQNVDPSAYRQNQAQSFANVLVNMFAPSVSQRPNMQPTPSV